MGARSFLSGRVTLHHGDSRDVLRDMADGSVDSVCTDPPYALVSIVKRFGKDGAAACKVPEGGTGAYARASAGFMGKQWDTGETAFAAEFWAEVLRVLKPGGHVLAFSGTRTYHRLACAIEDAGFEIRDQIQWLFGSGFPKSHNAGSGWGTALKPANEPIVLARKPLIGTVAANVLAHGTGAINIDGCRVHAEDAQGGEYTVKRLKPGAELNRTGGNWRPEDGVEYRGEMKPGRWPANIIHDGSEEVLAAFPSTGDSHPPANEGSIRKNQVFGKDIKPREFHPGFADSGSAARFFYTAKADGLDRIGSKHPTVKPVDLMRYLCRLVTPPGGTVLDPFAGTGTTGEAAWLEGFSAILIEREAEYVADIERRMALCLAGPEEKARAIIKAKGKTEAPGPLFAESAA